MRGSSDKPGSFPDALAPAFARGRRISPPQRAAAEARVQMRRSNGFWAGAQTNQSPGKQASAGHLRFMRQPRAEAVVSSGALPTLAPDDDQAPRAGRRRAVASPGGSEREPLAGRHARARPLRARPRHRRRARSEAGSGSESRLSETAVAVRTGASTGTPDDVLGNEDL
jgi:hypothetical protein